MSRLGGVHRWLLVVSMSSILGAGCSGSDATVVLPFVPFEVSDTLVPPLPNETTRSYGYFEEPPTAGFCSVRVLLSRGVELYLDPDQAAFSSATSRSANPKSERHIEFRTSRWADQTDFERAARTVTEATRLPCFSEWGVDTAYAEPVKLDGLPDGATAVRWLLTFPAKDAMSVALFDVDRQIMMTVTWWELSESDGVPTDEFVDVANQAWAEFVADNPPLD